MSAAAFRTPKSRASVRSRRVPPADGAALAV
jgi:hypothetical protein